ncbi:MAG: hypothetical protein IKS47_05345 [Bacteroidales bacterium]|nr:hypothetical protein [Bacteroidales bacterium]
MKKITTLFLILATAAGLYAQTADDALNIAQERYEGTARSMAMGNAFTALGGDLGGLGINPAASGVFRHSQFTFTPTLTFSRSNVDYLGNHESTTGLGLGLSNLGVVLSFDTDSYNGLLNYSFGFVYNKKNNFRSKMNARGSTNQSSMLGSYASRLNLYDPNKGWWTDINKASLEASNAYSNLGEYFWPGIMAWNDYALAPFYTDEKETNYIYIASTEDYENGHIQTGGMLNQRFNRRTYGGVEEFAFNFGGNLGDFLYFGANLNLHTVSQTTEEYYEEKAQNSRDFQDGFRSMDNSFWLRTSGAGANFKFGVILTPFGGLRLGATITTPTWYSLTDQWDYTMNTAYDNNNTYTETSPTGSYTYRLTAPMRWSLGAAYTFLDRALLSVDYESVNYAKMCYRTENGNEGDFAATNMEIRDYFGRSHVVRAGAEVRLNWLLSLRGGYQYYSPATSYTKGMHVYSAGIGFNLGDQASIDLAWVRTSTQSTQFMLYDDYMTYADKGYNTVSAPEGTNRFGQSQLTCTFALKF